MKTDSTAAGSFLSWKYSSSLYKRKFPNELPCCFWGWNPAAESLQVGSVWSGAARRCWHGRQRAWPVLVQHVRWERSPCPNTRAPDQRENADRNMIHRDFRSVPGSSEWHEHREPAGCWLGVYTLYTINWLVDWFTVLGCQYLGTIKRLQKNKH